MHVAAGIGFLTFKFRVLGEDKCRKKCLVQPGKCGSSLVDRVAARGDVCLPSRGFWLAREPRGQQSRPRSAVLIKCIHMKSIKVCVMTSSCFYLLFQFCVGTNSLSGPQGEVYFLPGAVKTLGKPQVEGRCWSGLRRLQTGCSLRPPLPEKACPGTGGFQAMTTRVQAS